MLVVAANQIYASSTNTRTPDHKQPSRKSVDPSRLSAVWSGYLYLTYLFIHLCNDAVAESV
jgi:hypothetical protein